MAANIRFDNSLPPWLGAGIDLIPSLNRFYTEMLADEAAVPRFFGSSYVQRTNGFEIDYQGLVEHLRHIRSFSSQTIFRVEDAVASEGVVAERHIVEMIDREGDAIIVETSCFIRFADERIADMYEVYRLVSGEAGFARFLASD